MKLPKSVTTVTLFSKILAAFIFFLFIISAFYAGMGYQQKIDLLEKQLAESNLLSEIRKPTPTPNLTVNPDSIGTNWKTYTNEKYGFSFRYPLPWNTYQDITSPNLININTNVYSGYQEGPMEPRELVTFKLFVNIENQDLFNNWVKETSYKSKLNITNITVGNLPAYQTINFPGGMLESLDTFIEIGNKKHLRITLWPYFKTPRSDNQEIIRLYYDKILSTFIFLD